MDQRPEGLESCFHSINSRRKAQQSALAECVSDMEAEAKSREKSSHAREDEASVPSEEEPGEEEESQGEDGEGAASDEADEDPGGAVGSTQIRTREDLQKGACPC